MCILAPLLNFCKYVYFIVFIENILYLLAEKFQFSFIAFFSAYIASRTLLLHTLVEKAFTATIIMWSAYHLILITETIIDQKILNRKTASDEEIDTAAIHLVNMGISATLWIIGVLMALSSLGINVTALATGLGIGGIAVALAAQNILGDLFSSLSIYFDKPFKIGDLITFGNLPVTNNNTGTVEKIGLKTTRLRGLQGEELIISNKELTATRIQNFKMMPERKVTFTISISPETPAKKLREIPKIISDIILKEDGTNLNNVYFKNFGEKAFEFEIAYSILSPEYSEYINIQQNINIGIVDKFEREKILGLSGKGLVRL